TKLYNVIHCARRAAQRLELNGVQAYSDLEGPLQGLHTLPTATVDYRGVRLSAQGLAPGSDAPEPGGLMYGLNAGPQESPTRMQFMQLLARAAKSLSLQRHTVVGPSGHKVCLFTSVNAQGLMGGDGRFYLLDLLRTLPADANFCPEAAETEEAAEVVQAVEVERAPGTLKTTNTAAKGDEENEKEKEKEEKEEEEVAVAVEVEVEVEVERLKCVVAVEDEGEGGGADGWPESYRLETGLPRSYTHGLCRLRRELLHAFVQHK
ncbi:hypothetical protein CRUP_013661, partial [Coryphaenoides rupestris]